MRTSLNGRCATEGCICALRVGSRRMLTNLRDRRATDISNSLHKRMSVCSSKAKVSSGSCDVAKLRDLDNVGRMQGRPKVSIAQ